MSGESGSKRKKNVDDESSSKKKKNRISSTFYKPKDWDFIIPQNNWFKGKVTLYSPHAVIMDLNNKFSPQQMDLFKNTCFGAYIDLNVIELQPQLIHQLLLRQVKQPDTNEMWFNIQDKLVRFSIEEFCLISGLRCCGNGDFTRYRMKKSHLKEQYFKDYQSISTKVVQEVFLNLPINTVDKDVVDIGLIYLITFFLFGTSYHKGVDDSFFCLVESEDMNSFPWGKEIFSETLSSLKNAFDKRMKNIFIEKKFLEYRLSGFLLAFQVWIYETIPAISRKRYCIKHKPRRPRMLSWSCKEHVTSVTLRKMIFDLLKLEVNRMVPLEEEKKENYVVGLFVERISENLGGDEDDDDFEPPTVQQKKLLDAPSVGRSGKSLEKRGKGKNDEGASQINEELSRRLAEVEKKVLQSNTMIFERISNLEMKIQSNNFENRLRDVEERVKMSDEVMERLQILERKMDSILMDRNEKVTQRLQNLEQKVDSILTASNEKVKKDCVESIPNETKATNQHVTSSVEHGFQLLDNECELKDDVWQKVVEITDAIQAETEIEQENADVIQIDDEVTPNVPLKRQKKPAALLQSPWVNEFDSTSRTKKRVVKGTYAFPVGLGPPFAYDVDAFELWYNKGLVKKNKHKHFNDENSAINPCFYFSDISISTKEWWYELFTPNECLDDTHVDVCFYYLRKMQRHGNGIKINATTTDFAFDSQMRGLYEGFLQDNSALAQQTSLLSYVIGFYMPCNTNWSLVDHVLIPVRMSNSAHWILCHFDIQHMCLNVYNSYHKVVRKALVLEAVQPFSIIIPRLLFHTGFYDGKGIVEEDAIKPLVVKMVPKLPQQKNGGDCGIYVIKYAQYFINGQLDEMPKTFNIPHIRRNLCAQLYAYAKKKQDEDYDTDNEWLSKDSL